MRKMNYLEMIKTLVSHEVEFVIVGGVAAALRGVPINTFDLDIVHFREPANIERLVAALQALDAVYRFQPELRRRPDETHLTSAGHQLLITRFGPLDVLGSIGRGRTFRDLLPHAAEMALSQGLRVRVLDLASQIAVKEETGGEKDLAALPLLRRALDYSGSK